MSKIGARISYRALWIVGLILAPIAFLIPLTGHGGWLWVSGTA